MTTPVQSGTSDDTEPVATMVAAMTTSSGVSVRA